MLHYEAFIFQNLVKMWGLHPYPFTDGGEISRPVSPPSVQSVTPVWQKKQSPPE